MENTSTIYFKDTEGQLKESELTQDWMTQNRSMLYLFLIATTAKGKKSDGFIISIPAATLEVVPQAKLEPFRNSLEKLGFPVSGKPLFQVNDVPGKEVKKTIGSILKTIESYLKLKHTIWMPFCNWLLFKEIS